MDRREEVLKLAALARIDVSDAEAKAFAKEFDDILAYMGKIEQLSTTARTEHVPPLRNVFRNDEGAHESGIHTQALVQQFRDSEKNALKVKQIISHD